MMSPCSSPCQAGECSEVCALAHCCPSAPAVVAEGHAVEAQTPTTSSSHVCARHSLSLFEQQPWDLLATYRSCLQGLNFDFEAPSLKPAFPAVQKHKAMLGRDSYPGDILHQKYLEHEQQQQQQQFMMEPQLLPSEAVGSSRHVVHNYF